jgi:GPI mannosyltransferase 3
MWPNLKTSAIVFLGACVFRLLNTILVQSFFDPDEYWQSLEPAYCEVFLKDERETSSSLNLECAGYTWEWRRRATAPKSTLSWLDVSLQGPIRSYLSVLPVHAFYSILSRWNLDSHYWVSQGPKLVMAVLSAAPTDLSVWLLGHWLEKNRPDVPYFCLFCSMANWFHGYTMVRTFSNSLETTLLTISMVLLSPDLLGAENSSSSMSTIRQCLCFLLGGCSVAMRFSSIAAWVPMGILLSWKAAQHNSRSWMPALLVLIRTCALFGGLGIGIACVVDRYFYGFWTIPFLGSFHFNVLLGNSTLYGSHPWHWYITAGLPTITGLWLPFVLWDMYLMFAGSRGENQSPARRNVWIVIISYTLAHSLSSHKEFRFLLPILPLLCLQSGPHVRSLVLALSQKKRLTNSPVTVDIAGSMPWLALLFVPNLVALLYLGLFHQCAPISVSHKIAAMAAHRGGGAQISSVHYLTGACHSTPLHSYLHVPGPSRFSTWSLDCSPECRSDPDALCESELFARDPIGFIEGAYTLASCQDAVKDSARSCLAQRKPPTYLVTYAEYAMKLTSRIHAMGLEEVGRFSHGINGLRLGGLWTTGDGFNTKNGVTLAELNATYRRVTLMGGFLELSIDEMVLFAAPE